MRIALSAEKPYPESPLDQRFGRARYFMIYDEQKGSWEKMDNTQNLQAPQGAGIQSAANVVNAECGALISGHCGPKAFSALAKAGVEIYTATGGSVQEVLDQYRAGKLRKLDSADVQGHW